MTKKVSTTLLTNLVCLIALALLVLTPKASSAQGTYTCTINTGGSSTCDGFNVAVTDTGGGTRTAVVNLTGSFSWKYMAVRVYSCDPFGWSFHIGDSSTNDGGRGDAGSTQHDAELQVNGSTITVFGSDIATFSSVTSTYPVPSGCSVQEYRIYNHYVYVDPNVSVASNESSWLSYFFDFPPYDEADSEDTGYCDGNYSYHCEERKLYLGLNRTYGDASRSGSGVSQACVFLSSTENTPISGCGF
jgi:hypothetical protein